MGSFDHNCSRILTQPIANLFELLGIAGPLILSIQTEWIGSWKDMEAEQKPKRKKLNEWGVYEDRGWLSA